MQAVHSNQHRPVLAVSLRLISVVLFAGMSASVKYLGKDFPTGETIFARGVISLIVLALIAWRTAGLHVLKTQNLRSHALRSSAGTVSMFAAFMAVTMIPLANLTAINYSAPLFVTVMAMIFLGERIHKFRWTALGIGFLGIVIMVGPSISFGDSNSLGVALALLAALSAALAMIFLRSMSRQGGEHAITITFYFSLTSMVCALVTAFWGWAQPTPTQWIVLLLTGCFGVFGQLLLSYSYGYAEASTIAPLDYTSLIVTVLIGYFVFEEVPGLSIWIGAPLVIASGLVILWREYRLKKELSAGSAEPA